MDIWAIIVGVGIIVGIIAGIVQVVDYLQKRGKKPAEPSEAAPLPPAPSAPPIPHNLPPRSEFIGREAEKARVHEALRSRSYLVSIDGIGGIGKTVLALEVAHECLRASKGEAPTDGVATFDGFIWTTAKDRDLTLNALLDAIARTLEYPGIAQQPVEEKRNAVRKLLQERPHLLIVDNFETITDEGVRDFLLELPEPSKALVTTREQKLRQVWAISLKGLSEPEALALIRGTGKRLALRALEHGEDRVLQHLYEATGGAPLAIKWAVGQIKQRGQSLDTVLTALHEARGSIFDSIFARSWNLLSTSARQVLMVMPLFATSASREGIEAASDVHHFALDETLGPLVEMSLVDATDESDLAQRHYSIHPLTRAFATTKLQQHPQTERAAQERLVEFFKAFTKEHGGLFNLAGFARLEPELPNILAVVQWCWEQGLADMGNKILSKVYHLMVFRGYWNDVMTLGQQAIAQATEAGDELSVAPFRVWPIGWLYRHRGDLDAAEEQTRLALAVFEQVGEEREIAYAKRGLGRIAQERGELEWAGQLLNESLAAYKSIGSERHICLVTTNLADVAIKRGDLDTAWALCSSVLERARKLDDLERVSQILSIMGDVARRRGDLKQAKKLWKEALEHVKQIERLDAIADGLFWLAQVEIEMGETQTARRRLSEALETYQRLDIQSKIRETEALLAELAEFPDSAEHRETSAQ
jgi:tetratricopeptide (TPR) repeat protein